MTLLPIIFLGFMCNGDCYLPLSSVEQALVHIIVSTGNVNDLKVTLLKVLENKDISWAHYLDRNQVRVIIRYLMQIEHALICI